MKIGNKVLIIIIASIGLYVSFLIISDVNLILDEVSKFKTDYLPIILLLAPASWLILYTRWNILLRNSQIFVPQKENFKIFMVGFALSITPGKVGELIKSQLLKTKFNVPRTKTVPIVISEQLYNLIGIIIATSIGIWSFELGVYVFLFAIALLIFLLIMISSRVFFEKFLNIIRKIKFIAKYVESLPDSYDVVRKSLKGPVFIYSIILSTLFWIVESVIAYFVLLSFGITHLELYSIISFYTTSIFLGAISFLPMGIGVVEGSLAGFLSLNGVELSIALTIVILIRIFTRWYGVSIGFIALHLVGGFSNNDKK